MIRFLLQRVARVILTLLGVSLLAFVLVFATGNPVHALLPQDATAEDAAQLSATLGLDRPVHIQYLRFLGRAVTGDFGESIKWGGRSAMGLVLERFPATLQIAGAALLLTIVVAVPMGVVTAVHRDTPLDRIGKLIALLGQSLPPFWLGIMLIWAFSVGLGWLPTAGAGSLRHVILPAIALGWYQIAAIMRLTRSAMLNVMDGEPIKLARLKGLTERRVVWIHGLRNALIVPMTYFGIVLAAVITRTVVVEVVFGWPGTGSLVIQAVAGRDVPVITAALVLFASVFVAANLVVDLLYAVVDPRMRVG